MAELGKKPYHCDICGKNFTLGVTFKAHTVLHERESPYECGWCGEVFVKNSIALKDHMRQHLEALDSKDKPDGKKKKLCENSVNQEKECNYCHKIYPTHSKLVVHLRSHTGEKPFQCSQCNRKYVSKEYLNIHIRKRHSGEEKVYHCEVCGEKWKSKTSLARHARRHINSIEHKCDQCEKIFRSKKVLTNHKKSRCGITQKVQETLDASKLRMYTNPIEDFENNDVKKTYTCSSCGKIFSSHKSVLNHMLMHAETALHSCKVCGMAFSNKANLAKHAVNHANYNNVEDQRSIVCEVLESQEKITLYIKDDNTGPKGSDTKIFTVEERGLQYDKGAQRNSKKQKNLEGNRANDMMVIDEDIVIDVEEVIIADKDDTLETEEILDPLRLV